MSPHWKPRCEPGWSSTPQKFRAVGATIYADASAAVEAIPGAIAVTAHQSHAYTDGACLYFTWAGQPAPEEVEAFYRAGWDAVSHAVLRNGGALSHHHGVGLNRGRFLSDALGSPALVALRSLKSALDPVGILNPGKFFPDTPWGVVAWL